MSAGREIPSSAAPIPWLFPYLGRPWASCRKRHNWKLLAKGMTAYRVKEILGVPDREKAVRKLEYWYSGDGKGSLYMRRLKRWEIPGGLATD